MRSGVKNIIDCSAVVLLAGAAAGIFVRWSTIFFVDQRFHRVECKDLSPDSVIYSLICALLPVVCVYGFFRRKFPEDAGRKLFAAAFPLLFGAAGWILPVNYFMQPFYALFAAWAAARSIAVILPEAPADWKKSLIFMIVFSLLLGAAGGWWQIWSLRHMGMSWFDWGHFYEALVNTQKGRFFYLDLSKGCFLGSRFCISLLILLPVTLARSPELFLLTGALLIASGGVLITCGAKILKLPVLAAVLGGTGFLLLPGALNMMLAQLDGFHEVFLLVPAVFGTWCAYRAGKKKSAVLLWLFSLGVRESVGFMWAMWGIVMLFKRESRRDGAILLSVSLLWSLTLILWLMPMISAGESAYSGTVFFQHLGSSVPEIVMSPFCRPGLFWGTLFSRHNAEFYLELLLPFIPALIMCPEYLLILLPDLVMISLDYRFDSQNLLRHYQIIPLLILTIAAIEAAAVLYRDPDSRRARWISKIFGKPAYLSLLIYMLAAGIFTSMYFAQIPGLPAGDPRLPGNSDARPVIREFYELIPEGAAVSAGPGAAVFFAGRNQLNVYRSDVSSELHDLVILESLMPTYGENVLRLKLLASGWWDVKHSAYLDSRLIQLFAKRSVPRPAGFIRPETVVKISPEQWEMAGSSIFSPLPEIELKGRSDGKHIFICMLIKEKVSTDLGMEVNVEYQDGGKVIYFRSFGDGIYPACAAEPGEMWMMAFPVDGVLKKCRVDVVVLPVTQEMVFK